MEALTYTGTYEDLKASLTQELNSAANSFVKIGYLLRVAQDTDILASSGYENVTEFAKAEYGIDKTQVSRFININKKFSEGGYSDHLLSQYEGYGYAKLTLMLSLPDAVNEALTPDYTKSEINEVKHEVEAEQSITPLEVMMEEKEDIPGDSLIYQTMFLVLRDNPKLYASLLEDWDRTTDGLKAYMTPDEEKTYFARIAGKGRVMLSLTPQTCQMVEVRTGEAHPTSWDEIKRTIESIQSETDENSEWLDVKESYEKVFGQPYLVSDFMPAPTKVEKAEEKVPETAEILNAEPEKPEKEQQAPEKEPEKAPEPAEILNKDGTPVETVENDVQNTPKTAEILHGADTEPKESGHTEIDREDIAAKIHQKCAHLELIWSSLCAHNDETAEDTREDIMEIENLLFKYENA